MTRKILEALADENLQLVKRPIDHDSEISQNSGLPLRRL